MAETAEGSPVGGLAHQAAASSRYRADIDGLRAIAVAVVVLFHAGVPGFGGGYVGVDVFFVISGYLITSLIVEQHAAGTYSLLRFYERRVRRIFPALFVVLWSTQVASVVRSEWNLSHEVARSSVAATLFSSNLYFLLKSGYFAAPAETLPLLHSWSLAVEEQFYLVFPPLLLFFVRRGRSLRFFVLAGAVSLVACIVVTHLNPASAFYLAPYRAWELLLGAGLTTGYLSRCSSAVRESLAFAGLLAIALSSALFGSDTPFPGVAALLPCGGAALVIGTRDQTARPTSVATLLAARPLVSIGLISYSLYLWHWPILVLFKAELAVPLSPLQKACAIAVALGLAVLSYRYVEQPFRAQHGAFPVRRAADATTSAPRHSVAKRILLAGATCIALTVLSSASVMLAVPGDHAQIRGREDYRPGSCFLEEDQTAEDWAGVDACRFGPERGERILLWGDSHAAHLIPGLAARSRSLQTQIVVFSSFACPPVLGVSVPWAPRCKAINDRVQHAIDATHPRMVVLAARWERYVPGLFGPSELQATIDQLRARGLQVGLIGQGPSFTFDDPRAYRRQTGRNTAPIRDSARLNATLRASRGLALFYDPTEALCGIRDCPFYDATGFLFWDSGHLSSVGSRWAVRPLLAAIEHAALHAHE